MAMVHFELVNQMAIQNEGVIFLVIVSHLLYFHTMIMYQTQSIIYALHVIAVCSFAAIKSVINDW